MAERPILKIMLLTFSAIGSCVLVIMGILMMPHIYGAFFALAGGVAALITGAMLREEIS